jgi:type IV pilus assembly protein PilC
MVFVWYVWVIFPETAGLLEGVCVVLPPLTQKTLAFSKWMDANYGWIMLILFTAIGAIVAFVRSKQGIFWLHKDLIRIPSIGLLLHKLNIEIFCRVFAVLYSGSGDNITVIKVAAEACGNRYIEYQVKTITIPMMVAQGAELVHAMETAAVFTPMMLARFRAGSETGNVRDSARQMADYYEKETTLKLASTVEMIQTLVALVITVAIMALTIISSELALISPSTSDFMNKG